MNTPEVVMQTPEHPAQYWSLNQASKELGINKSTLSTDASKGKIQWFDQPDGTKKLFAPQLYSFYAERLKKRTERAERVLNVVTSPDIEHLQTPQNTRPNKDLEHVLEAKEEVIATLKAQIEDLKAEREDIRVQRDRWHQAYNEIKSLPAPSNDRAVIEQPGEKRGFLARLFGARA